MTVNGLDIKVEYKPIKHVHLSVYPPDGRVHISAPLDYPEARLRLFALQKWVWIAAQREKFQAYDYQPDRKWVSGEAHYLLGTQYRLLVRRMTTGAYSAHIEGDYLVACVHTATTPDAIRQTVYAYYRQRLTPILQRYIDKWQTELGVSLLAWDVHAMARRWGSCSKERQTAWFNVELAKKPLDCIEYVVAHELTHLIERNHTDRFHRLLTQHLPTWETLQRRLNEFPL